MHIACDGLYIFIMMLFTYSISEGSHDNEVGQDAEMNEDNSAPGSAQAQASSLEPMQQDFENEDSMMGHGVIESNVAGGGNNPDPNDVEQAGNFLFFIYFSIIYLEA